MKTKAFNLELAKSGYKVQTKLGNPVRIKSIHDNMMLVVVTPRWSMETVEKYKLDGTKYHHDTNSLYNLEMVNSYEA